MHLSPCLQHTGSGSYLKTAGNGSVTYCIVSDGKHLGVCPQSSPREQLKGCTTLSHLTALLHSLQRHCLCHHVWEHQPWYTWMGAQPLNGPKTRADFSARRAATAICVKKPQPCEQQQWFHFPSYVIAQFIHLLVGDLCSLLGINSLFFFCFF